MTEKKPYAAPVLTVLGAVAELTRGSAVSGSDGGKGSTRKQ